MQRIYHFFSLRHFFIRFLIMLIYLQLFQFDSHMLSDSSRHEVSGIVRVSAPGSRGSVSYNSTPSSGLFSRDRSFELHSFICLTFTYQVIMYQQFLSTIYCCIDSLKHTALFVLLWLNYSTLVIILVSLHLIPNTQNEVFNL